ncbi:MAG: hypothetical protein LBJ31_01700 [Treponema sp.]|nr:hypothetical protein [Treponema sp.]
MKKMIRPVIAVFCAAVLILVSCDFPQGAGSDGNLTVVLPGGNSGRSALPNSFISTLRYIITLIGPGGTIEQESAGGSVTVSVEPGEWTITVNAYDSAVLTGTGGETVTVVPGKPASVNIKMTVDPAYEAALPVLYIHNEADLRHCITAYGGSGKTFRLENDISVSGLPAGTLGTGTTLDGQGHTITLAINVDDSQAGLLGQNSGTVKNLRLAGTVSAAYSLATSSAGAVAGMNTGFGTIRNVRSTVTVTASNYSTADLYTGGIAGENDGTIENCSSGGNVISTTTGAMLHTGGIAGINSGSITQCYAWGNITSSNSGNDGRTGGIAGNNFAGASITMCAALNSEVRNGSPINNQGRIAGADSGTLSGNFAYDLIRIGTQTGAVTSGVGPAAINGAALFGSALATPGSTSKALWTGDPTQLNWPSLEPGPSAGEPVSPASPWFWGNRTIAIPPNGIGGGLATAYVPALWFE